MVSLCCGHKFCRECAKEHITTSITTGSANRIRCVQHGCLEEYDASDIEPFVTADQLKVYEAIKQDVVVGSNAKLKWCSTPNCETVIKRPGCCCKRKALCITCGNHTCFKCGKAWHNGTCQDDILIDATIARYLLIAECIGCKAPITKNGACNHMTCSRCHAEFCWICRQDYKTHKKYGPYTLSFVLGCELLMGDTALTWCLMMFFMIIFSPIHTLVELSVSTGYILRRLCFEGINENINQSSNEATRRSHYFSVITLGLSLMPIILVPFCIIYPIVLLCRVYQLLKMFVTAVLAHWLKKVLCCCCY